MGKEKKQKTIRARSKKKPTKSEELPRTKSDSPNEVEEAVASEEQLSVSDDDKPEKTASQEQSEGKAGIEELAELLRQRDAKIAELEERLKRVSAEFENFRRRQTEEQKRVLSRIRADFFRSLLPITDHLERALEAGRESGNIDSMLEGISLIRKDVLKIFAEHGVTPIEAEGAIFNPLFHEAVLTEDREDVPDQTIIQELQRGYRLEDRVLRPSMVKVARNSQTELIQGRQE